MKIRVKQAYACRDVSHPAGAVIEVTESEGAFLLRDAPGSFELFKPEVKEVAAPPVDKAVKSPPKSKAPVRRRTRRKKSNDNEDD
jgi:hypothetical protein